MGKRLYESANETAKNAIAENGGWLMGVPAIVADNDDPEKQHRVRVVIPSIDEDQIFDEWARQMVFCLGDGFGSAFIPPKGSEVVLFGQLGQKYNLFYASLYNEEMEMPDGFSSEMNVGIHAPGNLKFIAEQSAKLKGNNATVEAVVTALLKGVQVNVNGTIITIQANGAVSISGSAVSISSTGAVTIEGRLVRKAGPPI